MPSAPDDPRDEARAASPIPLGETHALPDPRGSASVLPAPPPARTGLAVSAVFGAYRLIRKLGSGGFGEVWEAQDVKTGRRVALKIIDRATASSPELVERFRREGRLMAALNHSRCVYIFGAEEIERRPAIAMELMPGGTFQDLLERDGPLPPMRAIDLTLDILDGLEAASARGILHRDVKPSNCFLDGRQRGCIGDFGLARTLEGSTELTAAGAFLGSPAYASPEQIRGRDLDARSDQYSLGATLYALVTGRPPFEAAGIGEAFARILAEPPPSFASRGVRAPSGLEAVIVRALAKDRERRFPTYAAFKRALMPYSSRGLAAARPARRCAAFLVDLALLFPLQFAFSALTLSFGSRTVTAVVDSTNALLVPAYFTALEALAGRTPGKALFGFRVENAAGGPPTARQVCLRSAAFLVPAFVLPAAMWVLRELGVLSLPSLVSLATKLGLIALCMATMRQSNGWAGVHELASRTRVRRRRPEEFAALPSRSAAASAAMPCAASMGRFGPFLQERVIWDARGEALILGRDELLGRPVWIHAFAREDCAPPTAQLAVECPGRLRWLQSDRASGMRWDAYEAPAGSSLSAHIAGRGPLPWALVRGIALGLCESLLATRVHEAPGPWSAARVWIDDANTLSLLDFPADGMDDSDARTPPGPDARRLFLLALLRLTLEGRCVAAADAAREGPRLALPEHARRLIEALRAGSGDAAIEAFAAGLRRTDDLPARVTRQRRLALLATTTIPLGFLLLVSLVTVIMQTLTPVHVTRMAHASIYTDRIDALAHEDTEDARAEQEAIRKMLALDYARTMATAQGQENLARLPDRSRRIVEAAAREFPSVTEEEAREAFTRCNAQVPDEEFPTTRALAIYLILLSCAAMPALLLSWLLRGGLFLRIFGIALQTSEGRPASRWRCLLRSAAAWSPGAAGIATFVLTKPVLDNPAWLVLGGAWLAAACFGIARPERGIPDLVVRTWQVPK